MVETLHIRGMMSEITTVISKHVEMLKIYGVYTAGMLDLFEMAYKKPKMFSTGIVRSYVHSS